jgi:hypothetical protein
MCWAKYVEKLRVECLVQLFDDFDSSDGMFLFLGAIIENGAGESFVTAVGGLAHMARIIEVFEEHHKITTRSICSVLCSKPA